MELFALFLLTGILTLLFILIGNVSSLSTKLNNLQQQITSLSNHQIFKAPPPQYSAPKEAVGREPIIQAPMVVEKLVPTIPISEEQVIDEKGLEGSENFPSTTEEELVGNIAKHADGGYFDIWSNPLIPSMLIENDEDTDATVYEIVEENALAAELDEQDKAELASDSKADAAEEQEYMEVEAEDELESQEDDVADIGKQEDAAEFERQEDDDVTEELAPAAFSAPAAPAAIAPKEKAKKINYEKFIGENLFGKIGIFILVIGVGLFVKYAIDQNWISEQLRTIMGFGVGVGLLALAKQLNKKYRTFSLLLAGGAFAIFYVTVAIAYHYYHLFSQTAAFCMLVGTTVFMSALSIAYNYRELAWVALAGGFIAPFMIRSGSDNYMVLFTYLSVLNLGMFALSMRQKWSELPVISFVLTSLVMLIYIKTLTDLGNELPLVTGRLFCFASVFYIVFLLPIFSILRSEGGMMKDTLTLVVVSNNFFYMSVGLYFLNRMDLGFKSQGLLVLFIALVNLALYLSLRKREGHYKLQQLMLSQLIIFGSLIAPLQFDNAYIIALTLASELVVLVWLYGVSKVRTYEVFAVIIAPLLAIEVIYVLFHGGDNELRIAFANSRFAAAIYCSLAALGVALLMRKYSDVFAKSMVLSPRVFLSTTVFAATLTLCYALVSETCYALGVDGFNALALTMACELLVLVGLFGRTRRELYEFFSLVVCLPEAIGLAIVMFGYHDIEQSFANTRFWVSLGSGVLIVGSYLTARRYKATFDQASLLTNRFFVPLTHVVGTLIIVYTVINEAALPLGLETPNVLALTMATETFLLMDMYRRSRRGVYELFALLAFAVWTISTTIILWSGDWRETQMLFDSNLCSTAFFTIIYGGIVALGIFHLVRRHRTAFEPDSLLRPNISIPLMGVMGVTLIYYAGVCELYYVMVDVYEYLVPAAFTTTYLLLLYFCFKKLLPAARFSFLYLLAMGLPVLLYFIDVLAYAPYNNVLWIPYGLLLAPSIFNLLLSITVLVLLARTVYGAFDGNGKERMLNYITIYLNVLATLLWMATIFWIQKISGHEGELGTGLSICLATAGAVQMALGMKRKRYLLRMISLVTFSLALLKLVLMDLWAMQTVGKIVVFVLLGSTLLVLSFLYQKLKDVLFKDDEDEERA